LFQQEKEQRSVSEKVKVWADLYVLMTVTVKYSKLLWCLFNSHIRPIAVIPLAIYRVSQTEIYSKFKNQETLQVKHLHLINADIK